MKMLFALTAAAIAATTLSAPASAGTIGCDQGAPMNSSFKATDCPEWNQASSATAAFAYAPSRKVVAASANYLPDLENEGGRVSGGAAN
jgi:hypothetical protein